MLDKRIAHEVPAVHQLMKEFKVTSQMCFDYLFFSAFQLCRKDLAVRVMDVFLIEKERTFR